MVVVVRGFTEKMNGLFVFLTSLESRCSTESELKEKLLQYAHPA